MQSPDAARDVLRVCQRLLVPGAIRSLADRPVKHHLAIYHKGELLNDPERPYQGTYTGDEDTRRKPAYHNGTAWTWVFPSFAEAWVDYYGPAERSTALAWLASSSRPEARSSTRSGRSNFLDEIRDILVGGPDPAHEPFQ